MPRILPHKRSHHRSMLTWLRRSSAFLRSGLQLCLFFCRARPFADSIKGVMEPVLSPGEDEEAPEDPEDAKFARWLWRNDDLVQNLAARLKLKLREGIRECQPDPEQKN